MSEARNLRREPERITPAQTAYSEITDSKLNNRGVGKKPPEDHYKEFMKFYPKQDSQVKPDDAQRTKQSDRDLEVITGMQNASDAISAEVTSINRVNPNSTESPKLIALQQELTQLAMYAQQGTKLEQMGVNSLATEALIIQRRADAPALQKQAGEFNPDRVSLQTSKSTDRQVGDIGVPPNKSLNGENVTSSNETLQEGTADKNRGTKRRAFEDLTNRQRDDSVRQATSAKRIKAEEHDPSGLTMKENIKEEVRKALAKQKEEEKQKAIPILMGTSTSPTDQPLTKQADPDDSQAKPTKKATDPDNDEFSKAQNPDYRYLTNTTLDAAQLSDFPRQART